MHVCPSAPAGARRRAHSGGGGGVGFLSDVRRMNVALTRARRSLWIIGHRETLAGCQPWQVRAPVLCCAGWQAGFHEVRGRVCMHSPPCLWLTCIRAPLLLMRRLQELMQHCRQQGRLFAASPPYDRLVEGGAAVMPSLRFS